MKIVWASTQSQAEAICGLVRYTYSNVFPLYFSDEEIYEFERLKVLHISARCFEDFSTLKDAFHVMASMQTLIFILESVHLDDEYSTMFNKNVSNLQELGLFFPFQFEQFVEAKKMKTNMFSIYAKAANELIV